MNDKTNIETVKLIRGIGPKVNWNTAKNKRLLEAFLALKTTDEAQKFLRDIMTSKEIKEFANRLEAATLLSKDVQYEAIRDDTGLSPTTIARIAKWLYGSLGGYRLIIDRISPSKNLGIGLRQHHTSSKIGKGLVLSS